MGCFVAVLLRSRLPPNFRVNKTAFASTFASLSVFYFLLCFLWFVAVVPRLLSVLGRSFPNFFFARLKELTADTRTFDVVSTNAVDHGLVASCSHTLSWLIGMLVLCFGRLEGDVITNRVLQKLAVFAALFAFCAVGQSRSSQLSPACVAAFFSSLASIALAMRNKRTTSKLDAMSLACFVVAVASSVTKISAHFGFSADRIAALFKWWLTEALRPNLPFCEEPFAVTPFMAQGASAMAHLPYVPAVLLAVSAAAPETMPTLDKRHPVNGKDAEMLRTFLWLQVSAAVVKLLLLPL